MDRRVGKFPGNKPVWQGMIVSGAKRGVPDISFDADPNTGAIIVVYGGSTQVAAPACRRRCSPNYGRVYAAAPSIPQVRR